MAEKTVQKMVKKAAGGKGKKRSTAPGLMKMNRNAEEQDALDTLEIFTFFSSFTFGFLTVVCGDSWMSRSPILNVIGAVVILILLTLLIILGGFWWLVTRHGGLFSWALEALPFFRR